jgi:periplasmic protein TonB
MHYQLSPRANRVGGDQPRLDGRRQRLASGNKTYPDEAWQRGDEGRAAVRFTVDREGRVLDCQLLSGTGSAILDAAVGRLLRGARLPPFPVGMEQERITITLQIRYALER